MLTIQQLSDLHAWKGSRLTRVNIEAGFIDWAKQGHYVVQAKGGSVSIQCRTLNHCATVQLVHIGDPPYTMVDNFSLYEAKIRNGK
eukprot:4394888-Amphidinium_carterae.1